MKNNTIIHKKENISFIKMKCTNFLNGGNKMDLINIIDDYLKNKLINYAILIKGEWGTGKTFFVKKNIIKRYNNALYISLYGISSIDKLSEKIYLEIIKSKATTNFISKFFRKLHEKILFKVLFFIPILIFKLLKFLYELLFKLIWIVTYNLVYLKFNINISSLNKKDFYGILKLYEKLDKFILVIDDLERCNIPIEEIMGFINDFVEHNNVKCILVANENEIYKTQSENLELKILTVANDKIEFYDNDRRSNKTNEKLNSNDLKNRIDYLYNANNKYKIIKEKVIGKEFVFIPKLENIYDNLAFKYKDEEQFYDILNNTKLSVIDTMSLNNFNNIRTLDFYFDNFYHIYKYINNFVKECRISEQFIYSNICKSIINGCICMKKGYELRCLPSGKRFDYVSYDENKTSVFQSDMFLSFDFVNEYLIYNYIEKSNIEETLKLFANSNCDKLSEDDPFNLLNEYWYYSSDEINKILCDIYNNIDSNKYNPSLYRLIIKKISSLEAMDYNDPIINRIIEIIRLKVSLEDNIEIDDYELFPNDLASHIYSNHIQQINNNTKNNLKIKNNNIFDKIFEKDDWAVELHKYVEKSKSQILTENNFFSLIGYKKIIEKLLNLNIKNVYYFKYTLDHIYGVVKLKDSNTAELDCLKRFKKELNKQLKNMNIKDPMVKYPFKILLEKIDSMLSVSKD